MGIIKKRTRHSIAELKEKAQERGWKLLSEVYKGGNENHDYICANGHRTSITSENFLRNVYKLKNEGCLECVGRKPRTIEEFKQIAIRRRGECLSIKYEAGKKLEFRCAKRHLFKASPNDIKNSESWCPECAPNRRLNIGMLKKFAESKGGECLSNNYVVGIPIKWKCKDGHQWEVNPYSVLSTSWCPDCKNKQETKCKYILGKLLNIKFSKTKKILGKGLELDGYSPEGKIAFEYNGEQHYEKDMFFNLTPGKFEGIIERDCKKLELCNQKGIKLIIVPYYESNTDKKLVEYIKEQLKIKSILFQDFQTNEPLKDFYANHSVLEEIRKLVESKGGRLISEGYVNNQEKLKVQCDRKHVWTPSFNKLKNGRWCPVCGETVKGNIEAMQKLASNNNGKCLSIEYINNRTPLIWQCSKGHEWSAIPDSVNQGKWCKICAGKAKGTIEEMRSLAKAKGGKCLSQIYENNTSKLLWECSKGHTWKAQPKSIKISLSWCPKCAGKHK